MTKPRLLAARAALLFFAAGAGVVLPGSTLVAAAQTTAGPDFAFFYQPPAEGLSLSPAGIVNREPYVRWKKHTGAAAEAVVSVAVQITHPQTGKTEIRTGSGFVVRCDGFVMVPRALVALAEGAGVKDQRNVLTFAAADGPLPSPQTVRYPRFAHKELDFALVKVIGYHLPGLPMLHPQNVREGMAVKIVYARPKKDKPEEAEAVSVDAAVGAVETDGIHFALSYPASASAAPAVLPGAVVTDAASGYAVGIVPGGADEGAPPATAARFTTFAQFHNVSNVVGLRVDARSPAFNEATAPGTNQEGMVWVPGGPVELTKLLAYDNALLYGGPPVACTPGFWIDTTAVTNEDYREFLVATKHPRLPFGWTKANLTGLTWESAYPANGMATRDAAAYAVWRGKRLVTPVEWIRASEGAGGPWLLQMWHAYQQLRSTLAQLMQESDLQIQITRADLKRRGLLDKLGVVEIDDNYFRRAHQAVIQNFVARYGDPFRVMPAGWRAEDHSVLGVKDVAMNVQEILQPNYERGAIEGAPKLLPPFYDPVWAMKAGYPDDLTTIALLNLYGRPSSSPLRVHKAILRWAAFPGSFRCAR